MQNSESTGRFFSEDIHDSLETWVYVKTPTCSHCPQIKFHIVSFPNIFVCVSLSCWGPVVQQALLLNTSSQPLQANVGSPVTSGNVERATSYYVWFLVTNSCALPFYSGKVCAKERGCQVPQRCLQSRLNRKSCSCWWGYTQHGDIIHFWKKQIKLAEQSQRILGNFPEVSRMFHSSQTLSKSNLKMLNTLKK